MFARRTSKAAALAIVPAVSYAIAFSFALVKNTAPAAAQAKERTVLDGVFTADQAAQGKVLYTKYCAECHGVDLIGGSAPPLKGERFLTDYEADNLARPFTYMKGYMPRNAPATLNDAEYVFILAHILEQNAYPAGTEPLTADRALLRRTQVLRKGGPVEEPNFSLVRLVGCLDGTQDSWKVTLASAPVLTKNPSASKDDDLADAVGRPLGEGTFKLLNADDLLDRLKGHKIEVKGLLIRQANNDRINAMSVQSVADQCASK